MNILNSNKAVNIVIGLASLLLTSPVFANDDAKDIEQLIRIEVTQDLNANVETLYQEGLNIKVYFSADDELNNAEHNLPLFTPAHLVQKQLPTNKL